MREATTAEWPSLMERAKQNNQMIIALFSATW